MESKNKRNIKEYRRGLLEEVETTSKLKTPLIWAGPKEDIARITLMRKAKKMAKGIKRVKKGCLEKETEKYLDHLRAEVGREREKIYNLALKHDLLEDENYMRYEIMSSLFLDELKNERQERKIQYLETTFSEVSKQDQKVQEIQRMSEKEANNLIDSLLMYDDSTIPLTYNHYSEEKETWRFN